MDLGNQALGKTGLAVVSLSGTDPAVFGQFAFAKDGIGDGGSYGAWKPGSGQMIKKIELLEPYAGSAHLCPQVGVYDVGKQYNGHELREKMLYSS